MSLTKDMRAVRQAALEGLRIAARWYAIRMQLLVSIPCGVQGKWTQFSKDGRHSASGEPPRMESGDGRESIIDYPTAEGAFVGVKDIGIRNMIGGNYMAGWDSPKGIRGSLNRRPWLSRLFTENRYSSEINRIVARNIKMRMSQ